MGTKLTSDLSQRQYAAIGKVASEWGYVEFILRYYFEQTAKVDAILGAKITSELGNVSLVNLILAVLHNGEIKEDEKQLPLYQHLKKLEPTIAELRTLRNTVVHLDWTRDKRSGALALKASAKGKLVFKFETWTVRQMEELAERIRDLYAVLLQHLLDSQEGRLQPLPPRPQKQARKHQKSH
jgi:hypothetical protein